MRYNLSFYKEVKEADNMTNEQLKQLLLPLIGIEEALEVIAKCLYIHANITDEKLKKIRAELSNMGDGQ